MILRFSLCLLGLVHVALAESSLLKLRQADHLLHINAEGSLYYQKLLFTIPGTSNRWNVNLLHAITDADGRESSAWTLCGLRSYVLLRGSHWTLFTVGGARLSGDKAGRFRGPEGDAITVTIDASLGIVTFQSDETELVYDNTGLRLARIATNDFLSIESEGGWINTVYKGEAPVLHVEYNELGEIILSNSEPTVTFTWKNSQLYALQIGALLTRFEYVDGLLSRASELGVCDEHFRWRRAPIGYRLKTPYNKSVELVEDSEWTYRYAVLRIGSGATANNKTDHRVLYQQWR